MDIAVVAAIGRNREMGYKNQLPWNIPADLQRFKKLTEGNPIIMGRKTFDSLGRCLPNRKHIILTHSREGIPDECDIVTSLDEAITKSKEYSDIVRIIGGRKIFEEGLKRSNTLYLTEILGTFRADAYFPSFSIYWTVDEEEFHKKSKYNPYDFYFRKYRRVA